MDHATDDGRSRPLWRRMLRQRRRILVVAICVTLAAALRGAPVAPAMIGGAAMLFAAVLLALAPRHRRWAECAGLGLVAAATLPLAPEAAAVAAVGAAVLGHDLLYGRLSRLSRLRLGLVLRHGRVLPGNTRDVWSALVPGESHPEDHWTRTLTDFDRDPEDPETLYLRYLRPDGQTRDTTLTFVAREPFRHCRYFIENADDADQGEAVMTLDLAEPVTGLCRVAARLDQPDLPMAQALSQWFDDRLGGEFDGLTEAMCRRRPVPSIAFAGAEATG